jgi:hypothetical protein
MKMKNAVFLNMVQCGSCKDRRFGGTYSLHHNVARTGKLGITLAVTININTVRRNVLLVVLRLLIIVNVVPSSPILVTLIMEAIRSSETSVLTRTTLRNIPKDGILHSSRHDNFKSYIALTGCAL